MNFNLSSILEPNQSGYDYDEELEPQDLTVENISEALEEIKITPKLYKELERLNKLSCTGYIVRIASVITLLLGFVALGIWGPIWLKLQAILVACIGTFLVFNDFLLMPPRKGVKEFLTADVKGYLGCVSHKYQDGKKYVIGFDDYLLTIPSAFEYAGIDKGEVALVVVNDQNEMMIFGSDTLLG